MTSPHEQQPSAGGRNGSRSEQLVAIPASARDAIGELAYYLDHVRRNLLEVNVQLTGSTRTVPAVLRELRDIAQMTERATVRVLEETEALLDEGRAMLTLVAQARSHTGSGGEDGVRRDGEPLTEIHALIERGTRRSLDIMAALNFQDITTQKVQHALDVLEEVVARLDKIRLLMALGEEWPPRPEPPTSPDAERGDLKSGQDLADEILQRFHR
jgi:chemotaxis regulatin CheY-phosphate phosphatase CheZ